MLYCSNYKNYCLNNTTKPILILLLLASPPSPYQILLGYVWITTFGFRFGFEIYGFKMSWWHIVPEIGGDTLSVIDSNPNFVVSTLLASM